MKPIVRKALAGLFSAFALAWAGGAQGQHLRVDLASGREVTPVTYGFHYEEIGMIGDGGLYAELVRNRSFEEATPPAGMTVCDERYVGVPAPASGGFKTVYRVDPLAGWKAVPLGRSAVRLERTDERPLNAGNRYSLRVRVLEEIVRDGGRARILNEGYYGMHFRPGEAYRLSFYVRPDRYAGELRFRLVDERGESAGEALGFAVGRGEEWQRFEGVLRADREVAYGMLAIEPSAAGSFQLDMVSLMPGDTWDGGRSVFRSDILRNMLDYAPEFLRFPGGCNVHGINFQTMYHWKTTLGDPAARPGAWGKFGPCYRTDGIGHHEFLQLCEYLGADAMYVTSTGMVCTGFVFQENGEFAHPEVDLEAYIDDMLDAVEYALGPVDSEWGAVRAANGHPEPFPLRYVEIGNEDFGPVYYARYERMFRALRERYPQLRIIANSHIGKSPEQLERRSRLHEFPVLSHVEILDEHYYADVKWAADNFCKFDAYTRPGPDLFIGELGIAGPYPTGILADGVVKLALERNGDLRPMMAERPLARNWDYVNHTDTRPLLLHDAVHSVRTFNFYLSKLFRDNKIDRAFTVETTPSPADAAAGHATLFANAGYDSAAGEYVVKVINLAPEAVEATLEIPGLGPRVEARVTTLSATREQFNTPDAPDRTVPRTVRRRLTLPAAERLPGNSMTVYRIAAPER